MYFQKSAEAVSADTQISQSVRSKFQSRPMGEQQKKSIGHMFATGVMEVFFDCASPVYYWSTWSSPVKVKVVDLYSAPS